MTKGEIVSQAKGIKHLGFTAPFGRYVSSALVASACHASLFLHVQAELQKGVEEGLARVTELEQRIAAVSIEGGDVEGEDPVSFVLVWRHYDIYLQCSASRRW